VGEANSEYEEGAKERAQKTNEVRVHPPVEENAFNVSGTDFERCSLFFEGVVRLDTGKEDVRFALVEPAFAAKTASGGTGVLGEKSEGEEAGEDCPAAVKKENAA
jgi:hypothetical protein